MVKWKKLEQTHLPCSAEQLYKNDFISELELMPLQRIAVCVCVLFLFVWFFFLIRSFVCLFSEISKNEEPITSDEQFVWRKWFVNQHFTLCLWMAVIRQKIYWMAFNISFAWRVTLSLNSILFLLFIWYSCFVKGWNCIVSLFTIVL